ncbi:unnamed protein product [Sympodiomycopsis kandeliae]
MANSSSPSPLLTGDDVVLTNAARRTSSSTMSRPQTQGQLLEIPSRASSSSHQKNASSSPTVSPSLSSSPHQFHRIFTEFSPSIESILNIAKSDQSTDTKLSRLAKAILRCSEFGDTDFLTWFLQTRSSSDTASNTSSSSSVAQLFAQLDLRSIRDNDHEAGSSDSIGMGPVTLAASAGHVDTVRVLVEYGADIDERDGAGWTPLMWAINSSNLALVSYLVKRGADVEARSHQGTSCEDFIVSVAPNDNNTSSSGQSSYDPSSPWSTDHEHIADIIFDQLQIVAARAPPSSSSLTPTTTPFLGFSSPSPSSSSNSFSRPSTPLHHSRSASLANHLLSSPAISTSSPSPSLRTHSRTLSHQASSGHLTTSSTSRRLVGKNERAYRQEADLKAREVAQGRRKALLDIAVLLNVKYAHLVGYAPEKDPDDQDSSGNNTGWAVKMGKNPANRRRGLARKKAKYSTHATSASSDLSPGCGALEVGADPLSNDFRFDVVLPHQMLVLGQDDVEPFLESLITKSHPIRAPWTQRAEPANAIFLALRFAAQFGDEDLLINLLYGTLERIEEDVKVNEGSMTHLAYWLFNLTLLLHYAVRDTTVSTFPKMEDEYLPYVADLINETYVTVIRDIERRVNKVLEPAMLEHEAITGMEEVRFEGEWTFMKTLKGSVKSNFANGSTGSSGGSGGQSRKPLSQIFAWKDHHEPASPAPGSSSPYGMGTKNGQGTSPRPSGDTKGFSPPKNVDLKEASYDATAAELLQTPCPRTITSLLTSALHVLQLYEINPSTIIQAFSQVFFWIGSELFNKVLNNKRYLCRSKAMQLRLNISALEDWAQSNALPLSIVNTHLSPLNQLISWLACQSSLLEFDSLIATMQGLRNLNPLQMRKAVRDYRYEINETRMSVECLQYLEQFQIDWIRNQERLLEVKEEEEARKELEIMKREISRQDQEKQMEMGLGLHDLSIDSSHSASTAAPTDGKTPRMENGPQLGDNANNTLKSASGGASHHHRSGTATENGPTPDSRSPSPSDDMTSDDDLNGSFAADTGDSSLQMGQDADDSMRKYSLPVEYDDDGSPVQQALAAQSAIDSLFLPGGSMNDYSPPLAPEPSNDLPILKRDALLSSVMLPFALPSRVDALIVSPGDAFGFGRGHFTGTGTASLRQARDNAGSTSANPLLNASSRTASPSPSVSLSNSSSYYPRSVEDDAQSKTSGLSTTSTTSTTTSNLFASGKGFAAGGYWQPVPILGQESFEKIAKIMHFVQLRRESISQRRQQYLAAKHSVTGASASASASRRPSGITATNSPSLMVHSPSDETILQAGQYPHLSSTLNTSTTSSVHHHLSNTSPRMPASPGSKNTSPRIPSPALRPASPTKQLPDRKVSGFSTRPPALNLPDYSSTHRSPILDQEEQEEEQ